MALVVIGTAGMVDLASGRAVGIGTDDDDGPLPETPTAFETRNTGKQSESVASVREVEVKKRKLTVTAVTDSRAWRDSSGKLVNARLVAFDPVMGAPHSLIRNAKIQLLVDGEKKLRLMPLARLSAADHAFIKGLVEARLKEAKARKTEE